MQHLHRFFFSLFFFLSNMLIFFFFLFKIYRTLDRDILWDMEAVNLWLLKPAVWRGRLDPNSDYGWEHNNAVSRVLQLF